MNLKDQKLPHHPSQGVVLTQVDVLIRSLKDAKTMIENGKPCIDVVKHMTDTLFLLLDCRATVAKDHIATCLHGALKPGQEKVYNDVAALFQELRRNPVQGSHH